MKLLSRPGPTKGCTASQEEEDDDDVCWNTLIYYIFHKKILTKNEAKDKAGKVTSRLSQFLDSRLIVDSFTSRPPLPPGRFMVLIPNTGQVDPQGHRAAGRIR
jgi:hypothetical protein